MKTAAHSNKEKKISGKENLEGVETMFQILVNENIHFTIEEHLIESRHQVRHLVTLCLEKKVSLTRT